MSPINTISDNNSSEDGQKFLYIWLTYILCKCIKVSVFSLVYLEFFYDLK